MIKIIKKILCLFANHILYRVEFVNKEVEESIDKCVLCPNHSNKFEPLWIYNKTDNLNIMAKSELFEKKLQGKILRYFGVFPIKRGRHDVASLLHAINLFKNAKSKKLLIFPEGERMSKEIDRGQAKTGPLYIAYKAGVPIIPVYITKNAKLFSKVKVMIIGPKFYKSQIEESKENH